jgi:hypothetical protein
MLLITASLLNSWSYLFEDLEDEASEEKYKEFLEYLENDKTKPRIPNKYMLEGIWFENECCKGNVEGISNLIKDGCFQLSASKKATIDGQDFLMYGKLDCLKEGIIYDIKKNSYYEVGKYFGSYQHHFYMELIPEAYKFVYLIGVDNSQDVYAETGIKYSIFEETYTRKECHSLEQTIREFIEWLKRKNLYETYERNWRSING